VYGKYHTSVRKTSNPDAEEAEFMPSVYGNVFELLILFVPQPLRTALAKLQTAEYFPNTCSPVLFLPEHTVNPFTYLTASMPSRSAAYAFSLTHTL
jgi:hypothetical protein